ncbi:probable serine/threonine-protein kinase MARK-B [Glycine soja]|uniref:probable serine/threonine-protein kinase MARK-B n=1 Tax=Glycine soja TaxID=3848 RepID=UPI00103C9FBC|nr:probable serine/threonine-protein kinase MARK-B [Glycine soja]
MVAGAVSLGDGVGLSGRGSGRVSGVVGHWSSSSKVGASVLSCLVFGSTTSSRLQKTSPLRLKDEAFVDSMDKDNVEGEGVGGAGLNHICIYTLQVSQTTENARRTLPSGRSRKYFRQIVSAVRHYHWHDMYHCDLKLDNILLDKDMNLKVSDFGLGALRS